MLFSFSIFSFIQLAGKKKSSASQPRRTLLIPISIPRWRISACCSKERTHKKKEPCCSTETWRRTEKRSLVKTRVTVGRNPGQRILYLEFAGGAL